HIQPHPTSIQPHPVRCPWSSRCVGSRKYAGPILLPAGRVSVRAVAVTRDGRRSSVVTKVFSVETSPRRGTLSGHAHSDDTTIKTHPLAETRPVKSIINERQTDFQIVFYCVRISMLCPRCLCVCPSDPFARFCPQCGAVIPPVPALRPPPAGRGQLLPCPSCRCLVPINSQTCWTCEASTDGSRASFSLQVSSRCIAVSKHGSGFDGTGTSTRQYSHRQNQVKPVLGGGSAPSSGPVDGSMWSCSSCRHLNRHDARFCDRCGTKAGHAPCWVTCWRCGESAPLDAPHCAACGVFLLALAPPTPCNDITPPEEDASPASRRGVAPPPVNRSTQTVGLYYPSAIELQQQDQQRAMWRRREAARSDRRPPLSAVSPGRGYWRNQLDHVCAHLRSYTQNQASFRTLLAEPRLGRMVSALVQQNQDEVVLMLSFSLAADQNLQVRPGLGR
uniref:RanBP2-type domain-containing protein n=1 Tax=Poecilia latipinna TaxID=48699 RepID=A0A3B3VZT6_9TELE